MPSVCDLLYECGYSNSHEHVTRDLHQPIKMPTRITPNPASLLDMFLVKPKEIVKTSSVLDVGNSDHSVITLTLCWRKPKSPSPCVVRRSYEKFNSASSGKIWLLYLGQ